MAGLPEISAEHMRFVEEYTKDRNGTRAAFAADLSATYFGAAQAARTLLKNPQIRAAVKHVFGVQARRLRTELPDIIREWAILGRSDLDDYALDAEGRVTTVPGVPRAALRAVRKVKLTRTETLRGTGEGSRIVVETRADIELHDKAGPLKALYEHFHGALPGEQGATESDALGRLAALVNARRPVPDRAGGGGGGPGAGAAVDPAAGAAEPGVPQ